ncbi:MAG TPA: hypothetical protein PKD37_07050 [Oligoflexia bacterium]|nr:hypothetical protein [Oligoflexia bacterium]HMP27720.1 hypothetical protein [Oligoflexia bacterium]
MTSKLKTIYLLAIGLYLLGGANFIYGSIKNKATAAALLEIENSLAEQASQKPPPFIINYSAELENLKKLRSRKDLYSTITLGGGLMFLLAGTVTIVYFILAQKEMSQ